MKNVDDYDTFIKYVKIIDSNYRRINVKLHKSTFVITNEKFEN